MFARSLVVVSVVWATTASAQPPEPEPTPNETTAEEPAEGSEDSASPAEPAEIPEGQEQPPASPQPPEPPAGVDVPAPPPASLGEEKPALDDISIEDWNRDDWMLLKPETSLVELDGYLRLRADMLRRLSFGNQSVWLNDGVNPPVSGETNDRESEGTGGNMRLRIEPQINVTDDIHIVATFDILDNLVLGSTAETASYNGRLPASAVSRGQQSPEAGINSVSDAIAVKRAYGRVTALNEQLELRFGRMPNHWGLGMMTNSGDCLDCDFGDSVDRVAISFKAAGHIFTPTFDWISMGPVYERAGRSGGQPLDAVDWDDVFQYTVQIARLHHPDDIKDEIRNGNTVINYGMWNILRFQYRGLSDSYYAQGDPSDPNTPRTYIPNRLITPSNVNGFEERRDANPIYTGNIFAKLYSGNFELGVEAAIIAGSFSQNFDLSGLTNPPASSLQEVDMLQWGAAAEMKYQFTGDYKGVELSLKGGVASGDSAPGFGAFNAESQYGPIGGNLDLELNNFAFSPDYHIDLLMFRRVVGTVTDAWYVRPSVAYRFNKKVMGRLTGIYSQALFKRSTPSCFDSQNLRCRAQRTGSGSNPMGLEFDAELGYGSAIEPIGGGFQATLMGGLLFPFGAFKNPTIANVDDQGGAFAWTIQLRLYVTY